MQKKQYLDVKIHPSIMDYLKVYGTVSSLQKINKALTNTVYKVNYTDEALILKIFNTSNKNLFNRQLEYTAYNLLKNKEIVPEVLFLKKYKFSISNYINPVKTTFTEKNVLTLTYKIQTIHNLKIADNKQNLTKLINKYTCFIKQNCKQLDTDKYNKLLEYIAFCFQKIEKLPVNVGFTHNDLNFENFLQDKNDNIWILDFEYARKSDIYFDFAVLSTLLTKEGLFLVFAKRYQELTGVLIDTYKLNVYKTLMASLSCLWVLRFKHSSLFNAYYNNSSACYNLIR